jgi:hypothetical protein
MDELTVHTSDEVGQDERRLEIGLIAAAQLLSNPNYQPSKGRTWHDAALGLAQRFAADLKGNTP